MLCPFLTSTSWLTFIRSEQDKEPEHEAASEAVVSGPFEEASAEGMHFSMQNEGLLHYICDIIFGCMNFKKTDCLKCY